ncbi:hypothetical protein RUND412_004306 [Rhizina undulata]
MASKLLRSPRFLHSRKLSATASARNSNNISGNGNGNNNARRLSDLKLRLGRIFFHGATKEEVAEASVVLKDLSENWREYVAGTEGFLTEEKRRGLFRHSVVWGDMLFIVTLSEVSFIGFNAHVNNVVYTKWAEAARINWAYNFGKHIDPANKHLWSELWTPKSIGLILRSIKVDYKFPIVFPDKVSVYHKLDTVGVDSFTLEAISSLPHPSRKAHINSVLTSRKVLSEKHQRPAARCLEDLVVYNYQPAAPKIPGKAPLPEFMKPQMEETLRLQKEAKEDASERMQELEDMVVSLERRVFGRKEMK